MKTEIIQDKKILDIVNDINMIEDNKKAIAAKYGINSNKAGEIEHQLWVMANDIRREHTTFTKEDVIIFNQLWNVPESPKKIREAMAKESTEFVEYYLQAKTEFARSRSYQRSFNTAVSVLKSIIAERHASKDVILHRLIDALMAQTIDFHAHFIEMVMLHADQQFDALAAQYKDLKSTSDIIAKYGDVGYNEIRKIWTRIARAKNMTYDYNKPVFLENRKKDAERDFHDSIQLIAQRIKDAGMDPDNVKVNGIHDDVKAFDIHVTDGTRSMHARSILAAEFSTLVTPHFRFIITNE